MKVRELEQLFNRNIFRDYVDITNISENEMEAEIKMNGYIYKLTLIKQVNSNDDEEENDF